MNRELIFVGIGRSEATNNWQMRETVEIYQLVIVTELETNKPLNQVLVRLSGCYFLRSLFPTSSSVRGYAGYAKPSPLARPPLAGVAKCPLGPRAKHLLQPLFSFLQISGLHVRQQHLENRCCLLKPVEAGRASVALC